MWREERPGALAPGSLAGTSRCGIPAWSSSRELPGNPCDAASSFGSFPGGQASYAEPGRERVSSERPRRCSHGSEFLPYRSGGRDRRRVSLVATESCRSIQAVAVAESGPEPYHQPETGKTKTVQNISDGYRLLPMELNSLEILLLREPIATMAPRAMRAAISAYSIRSWPDSSFIRFLKSSFITVLLVKWAARSSMMDTPDRAVGGDCCHIAPEEYSIAMPFKCYPLLLWSITMVLKPQKY